MKITLIHDMHGWAHHNECIDLANQLTHHDVKISLYSDFKKTDENVVLVYPRYVIDKISYPKRNTVVCIASFGCYKNLQARSAFCLNRGIYESAIYQSPNRFDELVHIPISVDIDKFKENKRPEKFVVGWIGNDARLGKNFEIVTKIRNTNRFDFEVALMSSPISQNEMQKFYDKISVLLVCSDSEGGPLTAIEAGACGVPVLSSCNMSGISETIVNNYDGFKCEHSEKAIFNKLLELQADIQRVQQAGSRFRRTVEIKHSFQVNARSIESLLINASNINN